MRVGTVDYSVDPRAIGRFVDVTAFDEVVVFCEDQVVARHERSWAKGGVIIDPPISSPSGLLSCSDSSNCAVESAATFVVGLTASKQYSLLLESTTR